MLQRVRAAHPTAGLYQAAELQWWWGVERSTDTMPQLFWFDDDDAPIAGVVATDFGGGSSAVYVSTTLVVSVMPDATPEWTGHVVGRGLAHAAEMGVESIELEVDRADEVMRDLLSGHGFKVVEDGLVECWLDTDARPEVSPLADGYRLRSRSETGHLAHHMTDERRPDIEPRLQQTSLYRPDLDLVVLDDADQPAAYGMFWFDPVTATGVVEPMRTLDDHQQRGLARHVLTAGIDRLAAAGARRISIGYEPENPASGHLYRSAGFEPHRQTDVFGRS